MAQNGLFNRFLNVIGLVDDEPLPDDRQRDDYGRRDTYTPARNGASRDPYERRDRNQSSRNTNTYVPRREDGRGYSGRFGTAPGGNMPAQRASAAPRATSRRSSPFVEKVDSGRSRYDYTPRPAKSRPVSRFDDRGGEAPRQNPAQENGGTAMFTIADLKDCRDIIKKMVKRYTVIISFAENDYELMQRSVDTLCGATYALGGVIKKASEQTYIFSPGEILIDDIGGDEDDYLY